MQSILYFIGPYNVFKETKLNLPIITHPCFFDYIEYYTSLLIRMKTAAQIVCSHTETNEEL